MSGVITSGFAEPALAAQDIFRVALTALAEPGTEQRPKRQLPPARLPLFLITFAVVLTLADHDTTLWLDIDDPDVAADFRFHCGCKITADKSQADFAVITQPEKLVDLSRFSLGSPEYPDRSTTLLIQVESIDRGDSYRLKGPGIAIQKDIQIEGLPKEFAALWRNNRRHWPQGVDVILVDKEALLGLPRSTALEAI